MVKQAQEGRTVMPVVLQSHRFTVDDYHRMVEAGILSEDDRVELLSGAIVEMSPIAPLHAGTVKRLTRLFSSRLGGRVIIGVQDPIQLPSGDSEPQPDIVLLRPRADFYSSAHPGAADVYLVIEVADTSVDKDREVKLPLYASVGILEAWLVNVAAGCLEVHRQPHANGYQEVHILQREDMVTPQAFPDLTLHVLDLLG